MFKKILYYFSILGVVSTSAAQSGTKICDMERRDNVLYFKWNTEVIKGGDFEVEVQSDIGVYRVKCPASQSLLEYHLPRPQTRQIKAFHWVSSRRFEFVQINEVIYPAITPSPTPQPMPPIIPVWKISMTWSKENLILQEEIRHLVSTLNERLQKKLIIEWDETPRSKLSDYLSEVKSNQIQLLHTSSAYWKTEIKGNLFFSSIPFGMTSEESTRWLRAEGLHFWEQLYAPHGLKPFPCGQTGPQKSGWYNREIRSTSDFKDLWIRMSGLGGDVLQQYGARIKVCLPSEIYSFLNDDRERERAAQFTGAYDDYQLGLHQIGKYYYDTWHSFNSIYVLMINQSALESLDPETRAIIKYTIEPYHERIYIQYSEKNKEYLERMKTENIKFREFPPAVMDSLRQKTKDVLETYIHSDDSGQSRLIYESFKRYNRPK
ncbi:MAG: hypothetical protein RIS64_3425 [Bacteroidota bacterium]|jgi:TRAP-type mannitol/chloroaromatic compound transport system substrate-binding protein